MQRDGIEPPVGGGTEPSPPPIALPDPDPPPPELEPSPKLEPDAGAIVAMPSPVDQEPMDGMDAGHADSDAAAAIDDTN